jgi:hypothetical protein
MPGLKAAGSFPLTAELSKNRPQTLASQADLPDRSLLSPLDLLNGRDELRRLRLVV